MGHNMDHKMKKSYGFVKSFVENAIPCSLLALSVKKKWCQFSLHPPSSIASWKFFTSPQLDALIELTIGLCKTATTITVDVTNTRNLTIAKTSKRLYKRLCVTMRQAVVFKTCRLWRYCVSARCRFSIILRLCVFQMIFWAHGVGRVVGALGSETGFAGSMLI